MKLKDYWSIVRKNIWMILVLVIVSGTTTGIYSYFFMDKMYEASTNLIVNQNMDAKNSRIDLGTINTNILLLRPTNKL